MKTYADAGIYFRAWRHPVAARRLKALRLLTERTIEVSVWLQLEVLAKPTAFRNSAEVEFFRTWFPSTPLPVPPEVIASAWKLASRHGVSAVDALHLASALAAGCLEFVTLEDTAKPMFGIRGLSVLHLDDVVL